MTPARARVHYRNNLHEPITIRRITGSGSTRVVANYSSMARVFRGERKQLVGGIAQQDMHAIVYHQYLVDDGLTGEVLIGDYLITDSGVEFSVTEVKPRRVQAELIGYDLTLRGP